MKRKESILAAFHKKIRVKILKPVDVLLLKVNRIAGMHIRKGKPPLQLLREMPALKIARERLFVKSKVKLKVGSRLTFVPMKEILDKQSGFMQEVIAEHKQEIKDMAAQKLCERNEREKVRNNVIKRRST